MKSGYAFTVVVLAAVLCACGAKDLTREQAKGLLADYYDKNPLTQPLLTGMASLGESAEADYFNSPGGKYQKLLEADGLIQIVSKGKIYNPASTGPKREWMNTLDISLTDKGRKYVTGTPNVVQPTTANTWPIVYENVPFCTREIVNITELTTNDDFARAGYTWKSARLSPFAIRFHEADPSEHATCNTSLVQNASATFERHDDGWKFTPAQ